MNPSSSGLAFLRRGLGLGGRWLLGLAVVAALLMSCSKGNLILEVDILSFLDESEIVTDYAAPAPPVTVAIPPITVIGPSQVVLVDGLGSVTTPVSGSMTMGLDLRHREGTATDVQVLVYMAETSANVVSPTLDPTFELPETPVSLTPGQTTQATGTFDLDQATLDLFAGDQLWVRLAIQATVEGGAPGDSLAGRAVITEWTARVVSDENLF